MRSAEISGKRYYTFQDLIGLRAAKELLDEGVALRSVHKSLRALRESLPKVPRPLSTLRIVANGQTLVVRDQRGSYDPLTGQLLLDFDVSTLRDDVVRVRTRSRSKVVPSVLRLAETDGTGAGEDRPVILVE